MITPKWVRESKKSRYVKAIRSKAEIEFAQFRTSSKVSDIQSLVYVIEDHVDIILQRVDEIGRRSFKEWQ